MADGDGGAAAIEQIFSDGAQPPAEPRPETPPEPAEEFQAGRVPKAFYREDGKHDYDGLSKSWFDTRAALAQQQARVRELEEAAKGSDLPWEQYHADFDWDTVQQAAPNAYKGGGADNEAAMSLLRRLHAAGVSKEKASAAVNGYYADLEKVLGEAPTPQERRAQALAAHGANGPAMEAEVKTWLQSRAANGGFSEAETDLLRGIAHSGTGLGLLHKLSRANGSTPPPSPTRTGPGPELDPNRAEADIREALRLPDDEWRKRRKSVLAQAKELWGE